MKPEISVVMKVHNGGRFLEWSVRSILCQTFEDFEYIILDDGSTDTSWPLLKKLSESDRRIVLLRNERNMGLPISANRTLGRATGKYIACQDADDWSYPGRLKKQHAFLERRTDCVAVGSRMLVVDSHGLPVRLWKTLRTHEEIDRWHMNGFGLQLLHPSLMARADAVHRIDGYREEYPVADDYDFILRLSEVGRIENLPDVLVRYTQHESNITRVKRDIWSRYKRQALEEAWKRRGLGDLPFTSLPNPAMKLKEGSRMNSLIIYGIRNIIRDPGSPEGWEALKGAAARVQRKWRNTGSG